MKEWKSYKRRHYYQFWRKCTQRHTRTPSFSRQRFKPYGLFKFEVEEYYRYDWKNDELYFTPKRSVRSLNLHRKKLGWYMSSPILWKGIKVLI